MLFGNKNVGKTSLLERFADDKFKDYYIPTIGVDYKTRPLFVDGKLTREPLNVDGKTTRLQVWDTNEQFFDSRITSEYFKGAHGVIVTYDITDRKSFSAIKKWMRIFCRAEQFSIKIACILVGNKCDLE